MKKILDCLRYIYIYAHLLLPSYIWGLQEPEKNLHEPTRNCGGTSPQFGRRTSGTEDSGGGAKNCQYIQVGGRFEEKKISMDSNSLIFEIRIPQRKAILILAMVSSASRLECFFLPGRSSGRALDNALGGCQNQKPAIHSHPTFFFSGKGPGFKLNPLIDNMSYTFDEKEFAKNAWM